MTSSAGASPPPNPDERARSGAGSSPEAAKPEGRDSAGHNNRMLRSSGVVAAMTVASRVLGLVRDRLFAQFFGATMAADAWNLAFTLPNLTRRLFGEGAMTSAFVPVFVEKMGNDDRQGALRTASVLVGRLTLFLTTGTMAAILFSIVLRLVVPHAGPPLGMGPEMIHKTVLTCKLAEWMLPYVVLINLAAVIMSILNAVGHFAAPAFAPVFLNVCLIAATLAAPTWPGGDIENQIYAQSYAVLVGGVLQILIQVPWLFRRRLTIRPSLDKSDPGYREVLKSFGPAVFGVAVFQVNVLVNQLIAWAMVEGDGAVTMLALGNRLIQFPWAVFSLALATVALPRLSKLRADGDHAGFVRAVVDVSRHNLYLSVPSAVGLCVCSEGLVRLFYGAGEFLARDGEYVVRTGNVVFYYGLGLIFFSANSILARAHYAYKDTRTPTMIALKATIINAVLNIVLLKATPLRESALALACSISGAYQTIELARTLMVHTETTDRGRLLRFTMSFVPIFAGSCVLARFVYVYLDAQPAYQGFYSLLAAAFAFFGPLLTLMRPVMRGLGAEEETPPADATLYMAIYSTIVTSTIMGVGVWAVQASLPPEGPTFVYALQRGVAPVLAGALFYWSLSGLFEVREYAELKEALVRRRKKAPEAAKKTGGEPKGPAEKK